MGVGGHKSQTPDFPKLPRGWGGGAEKGGGGGCALGWPCALGLETDLVLEPFRVSNPLTLHLFFSLTNNDPKKNKNYLIAPRRNDA